MTEPRCVIFDVDGTLVDSRRDILASMAAAFAVVGRGPPARADILAQVGLSLDLIFPRLAPDLSYAQHRSMVAAYKDSYADLRRASPTDQTSPLFDGAARALQALTEQPHTLLAVATGKSRRGLDALVEGHGWQGVFLSRQCADDHPSKPHPSMIAQVLRDTGADPRRTIMVGDTHFDMDMARAAGVRSIAVTWGYHPAGALRGDAKVDHFDALLPAIDSLTEKPK